MSRSDMPRPRRRGRNGWEATAGLSSAALRRELLPQLQLELALVFGGPKKPPGRDAALELLARQLLTSQGAAKIASKLCVEWSTRLRSAAGHADYAKTRIVLNCRLPDFGAAEIDRTLRHELAHLLAQFRAGRRRIAPHGREWRCACADLGIADEARCHHLPLPIRRQIRRYLYICPNCERALTRTRPLRRSSACLACCRAFNGGHYDEHFTLRLVRARRTPRAVMR